MSLCERLFPRFRPKRELRPERSGTGWGLRPMCLGTAGIIIDLTPDYDDPICVPPKDARGAVLSAS